MSLQSSYIKALTYNMIVLGGRAFGRHLDLNEVVRVESLGWDKGL